MKKSAFTFFLIIYWLVKWGEYTTWPIEKMFIRQREFKSAKEAREFIGKQSQNTSRKDFKLYRVEERSI